MLVGGPAALRAAVVTRRAGMRGREFVPAGRRGHTRCTRRAGRPPRHPRSDRAGSSVEARRLRALVVPDQRREALPAVVVEGRPDVPTAPVAVEAFELPERFAAPEAVELCLHLHRLREPVEKRVETVPEIAPIPTVAAAILGDVGLGAGDVGSSSRSRRATRPVSSTRWTVSVVVSRQWCRPDSSVPRSMYFGGRPGETLSSV